MTISFTLVQGAYIVAGLLFILALAGLSKHESARMGNRFGIMGMTIALVFTILAAVLGVSAAGGAIEVEGTGALGLALIAVAMAIGAVIGIWKARKVEMTGMPELIAMAVRDLHYKDLRKYIFAISDALNEELHELADAGCPVIQMEEPQIHLLAAKGLVDKVLTSRGDAA